jgi:hypothetical protein
VQPQLPNLARAATSGHVWTAPWQKLSAACSIGRVRSRVRPVGVASWPLCLMLCAERVRIQSLYLEVR